MGWDANTRVLRKFNIARMQDVWEWCPEGPYGAALRLMTACVQKHMEPSAHTSAYEGSMDFWTSLQDGEVAVAGGEAKQHLAVPFNDRPSASIEFIVDAKCLPPRTLTHPDPIPLTLYLSHSP